MSKAQTIPSALTGLAVPEILAPAGGRAQFLAALNAGADAVYLGLKDFNARARAENFSLDDLRELMPLANRYGMKVLITVNILVKEAELSELIDLLAALEALEVHAIIVQDLAVARLAKCFFPKLRLHASTQMAVHNLAGVVQAWQFGFRRVVLARELTAKEIKGIHAAIPKGDLEIEAFCHGSLCYSYSGLCFFSGAGDARSGNRGECAYTCRQPYKILNEPGHGFLFSMRDLDTSPDVATLVESGVHTLKIEGRKKDAQYVTSVVQLYRQRLDAVFGRSTARLQAPALPVPASSGQKLQDDLAFSFQRGRTSFFLKGRYFENVIDLDNPSHLGIRIGKIIESHDGKIRVQTEIAIERFDGLKIISAETAFHAHPQHGETLQSKTEGLVQKYQNEAPQFSLQSMWVENQRVPTAKAGSWVEIQIPEDVLPPPVGSLLYKVRSADLKRRVQKFESIPIEARLRPFWAITLKIAITENSNDLSFSIVAAKFGEPIAEVQSKLEKQVAKQSSELEQDLKSIFEIFGDEGFQVSELEIVADSLDWFIPRSQLKELKRRLAASLPTAYSQFLEIRKQYAQVSIVERRKGLVPASPQDRFHLKLDRLETLSAIENFLVSHPDFPIGEIVFEPKRAFLGALAPQSVMATLKNFSEKFLSPIRLSLPMVVRLWDEPLLKRWVQIAAQAGLCAYELGNIGALQQLNDWGCHRPNGDITGDFSLYALNHQATEFWAAEGLKRITLSVEDDLKNLSQHLKAWPAELEIKPQAILYVDTPLFIAEACSLTALHNGCPTAKVCGYRTLEIENPQGERFFVAHESCKSVVYAKEALSITHRREPLHALGIRDFRIDFLTRPYTPTQISELLNKVYRGESVSGTHTANFDRTLL